MTEVKFHTKPTQINRDDPIKIVDNEIFTVWAYPLSNGYCAGFIVRDNGMAEAALIKLESPNIIHWLEPTRIDIHTRQDLVNFVKTYDGYTVYDIWDLQEKTLSQDLHVL